MAREFSQQEGEDYDEMFAPVSRYTSIRSIISLAASMGWSLHQMDVKTALLNGVIEYTYRNLKVLGYTQEKPMYEEGLI